MKILIYSNTGLTSKQIGLTTEVVGQLRSEGHELKIVLCDNILDNCYFNRSHNILGCASCQSRLAQLFKLIGVEKGELLKLKSFEKVKEVELPQFPDTESLMEYSYEGVPIGRGVASSIISYKRDFILSTEKYGSLIELELRKSMNVLLNFKQLIKEFQPEQMYIFNGRFAEVFPAVKLAEHNNIPFYTIESGSGLNYELFKNCLPHSIMERDREIRNCWNNAKEPQRSTEGAEWFISRKERDESLEPSFTKNQEKGLLPRFDENKINIVIFNSSEDEVKAVDGWQTPLFKNQNQAITQILSYFLNNQRLHFYLRIHPNLIDVANEQLMEIERINYPNLTVLAANSPVDTYKLMEACDKVLVFSSSTGIEATYWGTPSILYGRSFYQNLDAVYTPESFEELTSLLEKEKLLTKPRENTLAYGYYMKTYGKQSKSFQYGGLKQSYFKGRRIKRFYPIFTSKYLFSYLYNIRHWIRTYKLVYNEPFSWKAIKRFV